MPEAPTDVEEQRRPPSAPGSTDRALRAAALALSAAAALVYVAHALVLVRYPWDWGPDEGLSLDYARRLLEAPAGLYARTVVPVPLVYTPLLTVVLAPVVALWDPPFAAVRVVALLWTMAAAAGIYALVRPRASAPLAAASAVALLAPLDISYWFMLIRIDGLMIALWLWAGVLLLPRSLRRGADRLDAARLGWGAALLMAAVLTKPTAVVHGAPLVLGWLWVDRRSGVRLAAALGVSGLAIAGLLNVLSSGGFLWVNQLWGYHITHDGLFTSLLLGFTGLALPVLAWVAAGFAVAAWRGARPWEDPVLLLVLGGLAMAPGMRKFGAWWNYLLPALAALVAAGGRWWGSVEAGAPAPAGRAVRLAAAALGMLALARTFPIPNARDERTAAAYYSFLKSQVDRTGAPLLANRPDYPYYFVKQPVEIDGSHFLLQAVSNLPGTELVLQRLLERRYSVVSEEPHLWPRGPYRAALDQNYRRVGICGLAFYYGIHEYVLHVPRDSDAVFAPPPDTRCVAAGAR